jgi:hypothetical protein
MPDPFLYGDHYAVIAVAHCDATTLALCEHYIAFRFSRR